MLLMYIKIKITWIVAIDNINGGVNVHDIE